MPAAAAQATPQKIDELRQDPTVETVWLDLPVHTCLNVSVPLIQAPAVWQAGIDGRGIRIAIVDTGLDMNHPDFAGRIGSTTDFTGQGALDNNGHGTHVAGIAAGAGAVYRGVAPGATIYAAKVLRGDGSGMFSDVMAGVEWAVQQNAHVINLSLGSAGSSDGNDALSQTCDAAVGRGVVMCVAAGNAGPGPQTVGSPGASRLSITVGATDDGDAVASFSSRGPTADGRTKPDVCFPGVGIIAPRANGTSMGHPIDSLYTEASGTSMATPHTAGTAALLLQAKPGLSPAQVKDLLQTTARNLGLDGNVQGAGRAVVFAAYQKALGAAPPVPTPTPDPTPTPTEPRKGCLNTATLGLLALFQ
ncbi:MAG: S8 family peptidase [Chloroflexi bacterium]|nr:S8 family peptidase [Chloroflexota bacterium]MBU1746475.1 S8 family peptidase [Chloroflexota bacterium]